MGSDRQHGRSQSWQHSATRYREVGRGGGEDLILTHPGEDVQGDKGTYLVQKPVGRSAGSEDASTSKR